MCLSSSAAGLSSSFVLCVVSLPQWSLLPKRFASNKNHAQPTLHSHLKLTRKSPIVTLWKIILMQMSDFRKGLGLCLICGVCSGFWVWILNTYFISQMKAYRNCLVSVCLCICSDHMSVINLEPFMGFQPNLTEWLDITGHIHVAMTTSRCCQGHTLVSKCTLQQICQF